MDEIRPWVEVFAAGAAQLRELLDGTPSVADDYGDIRPPEVFGDVLDMFVRGASGWIDSPPDAP